MGCGKSKIRVDALNVDTGPYERTPELEAGLKPREKRSLEIQDKMIREYTQEEVLTTKFFVGISDYSPIGIGRG
jgi:hypothetical protein